MTKYLTDELELEQTLQDFNNMVVSFNERYNEFAYAVRVLEKERKLIEEQQKGLAQ